MPEDSQNLARPLGTPMVAHTRYQAIAWTLAPLLAVLTGCQTTAGLPTVDDAHRRPINNAAAIELQSCKAEASALRATLNQTLAPQCTRSDHAVKVAQPAPIAGQPDTVTAVAAASRVAVFVFEQGQLSLTVDESTREALKTAAAGAQLIQVRGRSGAQQESAADAVAARRRAEAAVNLLKDLGVPTHKLRVSWQGLADESGGAGQGRRVEIEFFDKMPAVLFTKAASDKSAAPNSGGNPTAPATSGTAVARSPAAKP